MKTVAAWKRPSRCPMPICCVWPEKLAVKWTILGVPGWRPCTCCAWWRPAKTWRRIWSPYPPPTCGADVLRAQGEGLVDQAHEAGGGLRHADDIGAVIQPDFEQQDHREVPEVDEAKHGHGGRRVGREVPQVDEAKH